MARIKFVVHVPSGTMYPVDECNLVSIPEDRVDEIRAKPAQAQSNFAAVYGLPLARFLRRR